MNQAEQDRITKLLKQSLPKVTDDSAQLGRDLWPAMLQRLQQPAPTGAWFGRAWFEQAWFERAWFNQVWFDCALAAVVIAWLAFFPAAIPVLLYHL
jgi:hypothetical protein